MRPSRSTMMSIGKGVGAAEVAVVGRVVRRRLDADREGHPEVLGEALDAADVIRRGAAAQPAAAAGIDADDDQPLVLVLPAKRSSMSGNSRLQSGSKRGEVREQRDLPLRLLAGRPLPAVDQVDRRSPAVDGRRRAPAGCRRDIRRGFGSSGSSDLMMTGAPSPSRVVEAVYFQRDRRRTARQDARLRRRHRELRLVRRPALDTVNGAVPWLVTSQRERWRSPPWRRARSR